MRAVRERRSFKDPLARARAEPRALSSAGGHAPSRYECAARMFGSLMVTHRRHRSPSASTTTSFAKRANLSTNPFGQQGPRDRPARSGSVKWWSVTMGLDAPVVAGRRASSGTPSSAAAIDLAGPAARSLAHSTDMTIRLPFPPFAAARCPRGHRSPRVARHVGPVPHALECAPAPRENRTQSLVSQRPSICVADVAVPNRKAAGKVRGFTGEGIRRLRACPQGKPEPRRTSSLSASLSASEDAAEREGFEPSVPLRVHMISNHAPSTTRSSLPDRRIAPPT